MEEERHPWMKGFTISTLLSGTLIVLIAFSALSNSSSGGVSFLFILLASLMIGGSIWLLNISDGFKKWSTLSGWQQYLGYLIMFVGAYAGVIVIVIIAALKAELFPRD